MYIEHFGLSELPFQLTPDARYWFESRSHHKAMAYLGYGLAQAEGFIVITGEIGAGKSTLMAYLLATIDRSRLNALSLVSTQLEGDDVLRLVAQRLGLASEGLAKAQLLDAVEQRLEKEAASGKRTLLVVDEAQNLSHSALEELRMLSNFQSGGRPLLQILLSGQPEFRGRINGPGFEQLRQRVIATHHLEAMEEREISAYMLHRLTRAGWNGNPDFAPDAFAAIYRHTDGVPRRINLLANRLLLHAALDGVETLDAAAVDLIAAGIAADQDMEPVATPAQPPRPAPHFTLVPQPEVPARPEPAALKTAGTAADAVIERRLMELERQLDEQDQALRRVLALLVEWVEGGAAPPARRNDAA